jgi:hypothetical protein
METQIETLERQLASARTTIVSQARELDEIDAKHSEEKERWHLKAWEIEKLVIELGNSLKGA